MILMHFVRVIIITPSLFMVFYSCVTMTAWRLIMELLKKALF
jgi:hypothetical protein